MIKNSYFFVKVAGKVLLVGATFHLMLLAIHAILVANIDLYNVFNIVDLSFIFPNLGTGPINFVIGWTIILCIYLVCLYLDRNKR